MSSLFLTPPSLDRPVVPKRLLPTSHHSPPSPSPIPFASPSFYPSSSSSPQPKRPMPKRAHSFCGDPSTPTFALASASSASFLAQDKRRLVAPPLERTLSSIGCSGNPGMGGGGMMERPVGVLGRRQTEPSVSLSRFPTPPESPVLPKTIISPPTPPKAASNGTATPALAAHVVEPSPPRPKLCSMRTSSSGFSDMPATPTHDGGIIVFSARTSDRDGQGSVKRARLQRERDGPGADEDEDEVEEVIEGVEVLAV